MDAIEIARRATGAAIVVNEENRIQAVNRRAVDLLGHSEAGLLGQNFSDSLVARDVFGNRLARAPFAFYEMVTKGEATRRFQLDVKSPSGESTRLEVSAIVFPGEESGRYSVVYELQPMLRRRRSDRDVDQTLAALGVDSTDPVDLRKSNGTRPQLTPRQLEVLRLMADGLSAKDMARDLGVTVTTVRTHVQRILRSLDAHSQLEAVSIAHRHRLL